ncbi:MAG: mechanosensitive ion channel family protein [Polyangiales bacterium]
MLALSVDAGAEDTSGAARYPLDPPDISSPAATLSTFLTEATGAIDSYYAGNKKAMDVHMDRLFQTLEIDLPSTDAEYRASIESALYLLEILIRIDLPLAKEIPGPDLNPESMPAHWTIPHTELRLVRMDSSTGAPPGYRFSAETVARLSEFYDMAKALPVRNRFAKYDGVKERYRLRPGFAAPAFVHRTVEALPDTWFETLGGAPRWKWVALTLVACIALIFFGLAHRLAGLLDHVTRSTSGLSSWARPLLAVVTIVLIAFVRRVVIDWIRLIGTERQMIVGVLSVLSHFSVIWLLFLVAKLVADSVIRMREMGASALDAQLVRLVSNLVAVLLTLYTLTSLAETLGVPVAPMLAGLGVGGLAVALAVRPTLENVVGGFVLFADAPVRVGEFCRFGDKLGTIEAIGLRSVRVRGIDRTVITIPNADFSQLELVNFSRRDSILLQTTLQLRYETTPDQLRLVLVRLRELLIKHPKVSPDPARVRFVGYGDSSLEIEIFAYVMTRDFNEFLAIQEDVNLRIKDLVEESGSGFAFPSRTLYVTQSADPDPELTRAAEAEVARWRSDNRLPFPDHDDDVRRELSGTLDYPPEGSGRD